MNRLMSSLLFLVLSACSSKQAPEAKIDLQNIPLNWSSLAQEEATDQGWLADFNDLTLSKLVGEAQSNNFDLHAAAARLEQAYAMARIAGASRLPTLSLEAGTGRTRVVKETNVFDLSAVLNWEIDIWGKLKDKESAATRDLEAQVHTYKASQLSLAASVARFWFNCVEAQLQLQLAEKTENSFLRTHDIIEQRFKKGISNALDFRLSKADLANARQNTAQRGADLSIARRSLEVLLGRYPKGELEVTQALPSIDAGVPVVLPAVMLQRRPDIQAQLKKLQASNFELNEAQKELLPGIGLRASAGRSVDGIDNVFDTNNLIWSLAGNLTQALFQGGRLRAQISRSKANEKEELANLSQAVLQACFEVESALSSERFLVNRVEQAGIAAEESREAASLALNRYEKGLAEITTLLVSQRSEFTSARQLLQIKLQRLTNRLNLYLALGGNFADSKTSEKEQ